MGRGVLYELKMRAGGTLTSLMLTWSTELINVGVYVTRRLLDHMKAKVLRIIAQSGRDLNIALMGRDCLRELTWERNQESFKMRIIWNVFCLERNLAAAPKELRVLPAGEERMWCRPSLCCSYMGGPWGHHRTEGTSKDSGYSPKYLSENHMLQGSFTWS